MAVAALLRRRALSSSPAASSCLPAVYVRCLLSNSDLHSMVNSTTLRFWRDYHNSGKFDLTDMTHPHMWYPKAREKKRNVFLHVGPTNSGKTHNALKRLEASSSGVYCGPLRLLAREVAQRLNKVGVPCNLITGQERNEIDGAKHSSLTVEMADVTTEYQCTVIDEIQMVGCRSRGFSFTRALLGLCSDELHVCGDPAVVPLIQRILEATGDVVTVQYYERLSPLVPLKSPLGSFSNIRAGDCLVTFSRRGIYNFKKRIEMEGKHLCSVVYGSLPPETRTKQATMFNDDSSDLNVLVASDAIGMGLNLNIYRIIFSTMMKFDGFSNRELTVAEIKQIAGRAGRYGSKFPVGEVTCLDAEDLPLLHSSLDSPSPIIEERFLDRAKLSPDYFIADCEDMLKVAAIVDDLPLGLYDKYLFCLSPVDMRDDISVQGLIQFAENYAKKGIVRLKEIFTPGTLQVPKTHNQLKELESVHKVLELYVWLSFRLEDSFPDRETAASQKSICSMLIEEYLERSGWQPRGRRKFLSTPQKLLREYDVSQLNKYFQEFDARSK
ncbi:ATP-dependent RNA helicase SUV3, mitochondrial isoform X2 [Phragmites australis]|uniref:ATP-dependent RNA helicase SUV3, mitochondrial isoform X2 n=1 Tax=Phragmites australis TaxID=29695 RepID=UPI002D79DB82|nr:ATP-dependent RNA helicase SUV3, mitochondrial isoform X2 [Phragmites australis]